MSGKHLICVDDDEETLELLAFDLAKQGYHVTCKSSGQRVIELAAELRPDLIVLDVTLPITNGLEICRELKDDPRLRVIPIILLSAKSAEDDVVAGLECGADDYVTKPFSTKALELRIRAILRRDAAIRRSESRPIRVGELFLDPSRCELLVAEAAVPLSVIEFRILHVLASRPGWAFSRAQMALALHGEADVTSDRAIDVQISGLRRKLGAFGERIETVRGVGYRLKE